MAITAWAAKFCQQFDLLVGEWANLLAEDAESADQFIVLEHRHDDKAARASDIDKPHNRRIAGCVTRLACNVGDVDHLLRRGDTHQDGTSGLGRNIGLRRYSSAHAGGAP